MPRFVRIACVGAAAAMGAVPAPAMLAFAAAPLALKTAGVAHVNYPDQHAFIPANVGIIPLTTVLGIPQNAGGVLGITLGI